MLKETRGFVLDTSRQRRPSSDRKVDYLTWTWEDPCLASERECCSRLSSVCTSLPFHPSSHRLRSRMVLIEMYCNLAYGRMRHMVDDWKG